MDLLALIQIVVRRWYATVPILLATIGLAAYVQSAIPPEYEARGSVLLEEPRFDPSRLPTSVVNADTLVDRFDQDQVGASLMVGETQLIPQVRDRSTIEITGVGADPDEVASTVDGAMDWFVDDVTTLQDEEGIDGAERLRASILTPIVAAEELPGGTYQATGLIVLRDPASGTDNPFSAGGGTTSLLTAVATSDSGIARISQATGPNVTFDLTPARDNASIITITTAGPDPADVIGAFDVIREVLAEDLDARQARADVPTSHRIVINDLAPPQTVTDVSSPLNRAVAAIVGVGGLLALGVAVIVEGVLTRRARFGELPGHTVIAEWWGNTPETDEVGEESLEQERSKAVTSGSDEKR